MANQKFEPDACWDGSTIRKLRYRMGWSQAELARGLELKLGDLVMLETGSRPPTEEICRRLEEFFYRAEGNSRWLQSVPLADATMHSQNLTQIHQLDLLDVALAPDSNKKTE